MMIFIKSKTLGKLLEIRIAMGSSSLFWTHPHSIDLILFYAEERKIKNVQSHLNETVNLKNKFLIQNDPVIKSCCIEFDDGLIAHITQGIGCDIHLSCEYGEVSITRDGHDFYLYNSNNDDYPKIKYLEPINESKKTGTLAPISQLISCLNNNKLDLKKNKVIKNDILTTQKIMFAVVQSHIEKGRRIKLDQIDNDIYIEAKTNGRFA